MVARDLTPCLFTTNAMLLFTLHAMLLSFTAIALLPLLALQALAAPLGFDNSLAVFTLPIRMRARTFNLAVSTSECEKREA